VQAESTCGSGGTADALASGASWSNPVGVQIPASAPFDGLKVVAYNETKTALTFGLTRINWRPWLPVRHRRLPPIVVVVVTIFFVRFVRPVVMLQLDAVVELAIARRDVAQLR